MPLPTVFDGQGGQVTMEPHDVPGGSRVLQCTDPQGAAFGLVQPARG